MTDLKFQTDGPPEIPSARPSKWRDIFAELREHPMEWATLEDVGQAVYYDIRNGSKPGIEEGEHFEVVFVREKPQDRKGTLWIRYVRT